MGTKKWDIFISHAAEDKATVAHPLAAALRRAGARVWLDEHELTVGDSLTEKIDEGLAHSEFGAVILSPAFFSKHWPRKELAGLRAKEEEGRKVILPVWHNIDKPAITQFSPILADVLAANTEHGIDDVARKLIDVIFPAIGHDGYTPHRSAGRRLVEILESDPNKETLIEFLRFHQPDRYYLGWDVPLIIEERELFDMTFDAYMPSFGHGMDLTLVKFTEIWKTPFETDQQGGLKIRKEITDAVSAMDLIQQRDLVYDLSHDSNLRTKVWDLMALAPFFRNMKNITFEELDVSKLDVRDFRIYFFVYAGRRSEIDASAGKHDLWTPLRNYRHNISVRSYDHLLDAFLPR